MKCWLGHPLQKDGKRRDDARFEVRMEVAPNGRIGLPYFCCDRHLPYTAAVVKVALVRMIDGGQAK